ncbi:hypothetical protein BCR36DRAFT_343055 [Piromyces finnis]|uniref:G-protein coupled receptors family 3 profile domain-containing protein n=1 Tax=Piromyces finnis TaxID=1754191 RepID=A0A1Y1VMT7_9FUNG|nr:hypothetical protein BCR36DRAFT_343055 [Piromyces finnis]|eukprot:ORX59204.1 hypothetical protein BCR36DRAFT_343055 [Piromyces finnis]
MDLKKIDNNFVTNPTYLKFDENYNNTIEIYSGDRLEQEYSSSIYDDYGNKFSFSNDINDYEIKDLLFYEISFYGKEDETLRSKIYGSNRSYCLNNSCKFKNLRLVGTPGDYVLELKIVGFGNYEEFLNNSIKLNVKIKECNEPGYIYQDKDGENIKSCYKPICNPKCSNQGVCINDNICDCSKTSYTGRICSERYRLEKNKIFNYIILVISIGLIIVTIGSIYFVFHYRKNEIIKAASYNFMVLILIGLILNFIYIILLTMEIKSYKICIYTSFINNMGFSLIFGSIISKTLRVYYM